MPRLKRIKVAKGIYQVGRSLTAKLQVGSGQHIRSAEKAFPLDTPIEDIQNWRRNQRHVLWLDSQALSEKDKEARLKGGWASDFKKNGKPARRWILTPEQKARQLESAKRAAAKRRLTHPELYSKERWQKIRRAQLDREQALAKQLEDKGYEVFSPTVVCDRIAVLGDKVFFVEFKKNGQELRPGQARIQKLVPSKYKVVYHD